MDGHGARSRRRLQESQTSGVDKDQTAQPDSGGAASSILLLLFLLQCLSEGAPIRGCPVGQHGFSVMFQIYPSDRKHLLATLLFPIWDHIFPV